MISSEALDDPPAHILPCTLRADSSVANFLPLRRSPLRASTESSFVLVSLLLLLGCAASPRFSEKDSGARTTTSRPATDSSPTENLTPRPPVGKVLLSLEGIVSYYAHDFQGKQTSNGETFNMNELTAAHRTFPFGTKVRVTNLENSKSVIVRVNDRGPFVEGRIMDLSLGAAKAIDLMTNGTTRARLDVLQWGDGK